MPGIWIYKAARGIQRIGDYEGLVNGSVREDIRAQILKEEPICQPYAHASIAARVESNADARGKIIVVGRSQTVLNARVSREDHSRRCTGIDNRLLASTVSVRAVSSDPKGLEDRITRAKIQCEAIGYPEIVLRKDIAVPCLGIAMIGASLKQFCRTSDQEICKSIIRLAAVEGKGAVISRRAKVVKLQSLNLTTDADGMLPPIPTHCIAELIDIVMLVEEIRSIHIEEAAHVDIRQLRCHYPREVRSKA